MKTPNLIIAGQGDCAICIIFEKMRTPLFLFWLLVWSILTPEGNTWLNVPLTLPASLWLSVCRAVLNRWVHQRFTEKSCQPGNKSRLEPQMTALATLMKQRSRLELRNSKQKKMDSIEWCFSQILAATLIYISYIIMCCFSFFVNAV